MKNKGNLLIIDDDPLNRLLLLTNLEEKGYTVSEAEDGKKGLELVEKEKFDVILLDLVMPVMNGYEVLSILKSNPVFRHIPILVISAEDEQENIISCIEMGAVDYLPKPVNPVLLHARINSSLANKRIYDLQVDHMREIEAQNKELDAFAGTVAHDLKNPISAIIGFSGILLDFYSDAFDAQGLGYINRIEYSGKKANTIIKALLLMARLREELPNFAAINMEKVLKDVEIRLEGDVKENSAQIIIPNEFPVSYGYAPWVEEIWINYLTNAIKYGGSPPNIEIKTKDSGNGQVRFEVIDNGPGIPEESQAKLFTPFTRLASKRVEGHGLGLSIVERIAKRLGGQVGVDSQVGQGSTFWFTLPAKKPDKN